MLRALSIKNFVLIDDLYIEFNQGLTVLTGETGAGKSIILDALSLVIGARANISLIKDKTSPAIVSAEFDLSLCADGALLSFLAEKAIDDGTLIIKRIISHDNKSRVLINNVVSSLMELKDFAANLVEICGQHDQRGLFDESAHIYMLDEYANLTNIKSQLSHCFKQYKEQKLQLNILNELKERSAEEKSYLEYIITELEDLNYQSGEEIELESRRKKLLSAEKLKEIAQLIRGKISSNERHGDSMLSSLYIIQKAISKAPEHFAEINEQINNATLILEEVLRSEELSEDYEDTQAHIFAIEQRLFKIKNTIKKYSINIDEIEYFCTEKRVQLQNLDMLDDSILEAQNKLIENRTEYLKIATLISEVRRKAAQEMCKTILQHVKDIKMDKADFIIEMKNKPEEKWNDLGFDDVRFMIRTNPGTPFGSISQIASGGELSRIMLAFKIATSRSRAVSTLIFDEIDSGISGSVSSSVGRKLAELSGLAQIIVVTHQPQVAVFADEHFLVSKKQNARNEMMISMSLLAEDERLQEVARMLSGEQITNEAAEAAKSLFIKARLV